MIVPDRSTPPSRHPSDFESFDLPDWEGVAVPEATAPELRALDRILRDHLLRRLTRTRDPGELKAAARSMRRLVRPKHRAALASWVARWGVFSDLLEARAADLEARNPEAALKLAHVDRILEALRGGRAEQSALVESLGLSKATVSWLLRILENHDVVSRTARDGRSKWVELGPAAPDVEATIEGAAEEAPAAVVRLHGPAQFLFGKSA